MTHPQTIPEICAALTGRGRPELARRLAYFASEEDLEPGDVALTEESAQGFWEFYRAVESEGRVSLTCSAEGWLCAEWDFSDNQRGASILFLDSRRVMFAATYAPGKWVEIDGGGETGPGTIVRKKLVEAGLFAWSPEPPVGKNSNRGTTLPDIAEVGI